jgi:hypothetical protein
VGVVDPAMQGQGSSCAQCMHACNSVGSVQRSHLKRAGSCAALYSTVLVALPAILQQGAGRWVVQQAMVAA